MQGSARRIYFLFFFFSSITRAFRFRLSRGHVPCDDLIMVLCPHYLSAGRRLEVSFVLDGRGMRVIGVMRDWHWDGGRAGIRVRILGITLAC